MFIFRVEHKREYCVSETYRDGGSSLTGHGPHSGCGGFWGTPNFGSRGNPPSNRMMEYERCAVTSRQFNDWITPQSNKCRYEKEYCYGAENCRHCPVQGDTPLSMPPQWHIVAYTVDDSKEGIDWRIDENQIIFNPAFADLIGEVTEISVRDLAASPLV